MAEQTPSERPSTTDQILDLLLDALAERQRARQGAPSPRPSPRQERETAPSPPPPPPAEGELAPSPAPGPAEQKELAPSPRPSPQPGKMAPTRPSSAPAGRDLSLAQSEPQRSERPGTAQRQAKITPAASPVLPPVTTQPETSPGDQGSEPPPRLPSINLGRTLSRLLILIAILIIVANVPVTRYGVSLARILPDATSLIIRDGLVLKGTGPEIYVMEEGKLRWISSMDAFEHLGLTWQDVHVVEDAFLDTFEKGRPIHVLLKCRESPHIYRLENDQKRWIRDIDTFLAEGHVWDDVRFVTCEYLQGLPDGPAIPEDAGPPPEP